MPRSARARKALAVVAIVAVTALVVGLVQLRRTTLEAQALERAEAREGLAQEVTALTASLTEPLREIDAASEPTLTVLAETLAGTNGDAEELLDDLDAAVTRMLVAAGELDQASERPVPERPRVLQVEEVEPILDRLVVLQELAAEVARDVRAAAVEAQTYGRAAHELAGAAATFATATAELPDSDDPDVVADAWEEELERLGAYRAAIDRAARASGLEPLVTEHRDLVDMLWTLAEAAIEDLEEGDIDAYNERLEAALEEQDPGQVRDALVAASRQALRGEGVTRLEDARARVRALLSEVERFEASVEQDLRSEEGVGGPAGR